jgi:hypothetical protein
MQTRVKTRQSTHDHLVLGFGEYFCVEERVGLQSRKRGLTAEGLPCADSSADFGVAGREG